MEIENNPEKGPHRVVAKYREKVEKAWENYEQVKKARKQLDSSAYRLNVRNFNKTGKEETKKSEHDQRLETLEAKMKSKLKKFTKQRPLDHAVLYLVQHPDLMKEDPLSTERLLLCCWESKQFKNLTVVMDMLIEAGVVITLSELESIVLEYIRKGVLFNENLHKYVQYLNFAKVFALPPTVWKEYLGEILAFSRKVFKNELPDCEDPQEHVNDIITCFINVYRNTCEEEVSSDFNKILEATFHKLESYITNCTVQKEVEMQRKFVVRPFLLAMINNTISLANLFKNEFYRDFFVTELNIWGAENPDFFKALFTKIGKEGFTTGKIPWSVFKCLKDELKKEESQDLYFFVTKYFFDHYDSNEEVCNYIFSIPEYKELIKYFLANNSDLQDSKIEMNSQNEAEYDGFVIV